jgi:fructose/tagatose bisphosphate aldolase
MSKGRKVLYATNAAQCESLDTMQAIRFAAEFSTEPLVVAWTANDADHGTSEQISLITSHCESFCQPMLRVDKHMSAKQILLASECFSAPTAVFEV